MGSLLRKRIDTQSLHQPFSIRSHLSDACPASAALGHAPRDADALHRGATGPQKQPGLLHPLASVLGLKRQSVIMEGHLYQRTINRHNSGAITGTNPLYDANC